MVLMNTLSSRVQAWSGLTLSTLLFLTSLIAFLTHPSPKSIRSYNADSQLNITSVQPVYGRSIWHLDRHLQEFLEVQWSFKGDFTQRSARAVDDHAAASPLGSLWTWNTKQLYLSLVVQWISPADGAHHEAVVWDRIIRRKEDAMELNVTEQGNKYGVRELTRKWSAIPSARFTLKWNAMPKVGLLAYGNEANSGEIAIPARVITERELEEGRKHTGRKMPY